MSEEQDEIMLTRLAEMLELARLLGLEPDSRTLARDLMMAWIYEVSIDYLSSSQ